MVIILSRLMVVSHEAKEEAASADHPDWTQDSLRIHVSILQEECFGNSKWCLSYVLSFHLKV